MRRGTLAVFSLSVAIPASSQTLLIPAIPTLAEERGFSVVANGWLLSAFLIAASMAAPLLGRIGDLRGRRHLTVLTGAAYVVGSLICLVGGDYGLAVSIGRAFQGVSAGVFVLHIAAIQQLVPSAAARATHIGVLSGVVAMGPAVGFLVGGAVTAQLGVSALFVIGIVVGAVSTILLWFFTPVSGGSVQGSVDVRGAVLVALSLSFLLTFLTEIGVSGLTGRTTTLAFVCTVVTLALTVVWMRRAEEPFIDLVLLRDRVGALANTATVLSSAAMFGLFVAVPQLIQDDVGGLGFGPIAAGLFLAPGALVMVLVGPVASRFGAARGYGIVIIVGNALCAVGMLGLGILPQTVALVLLLATVSALGIGTAFPAMPSAVMAAAPPGSVGVAAGINSLMRGFGSAAGAQVALMVSVTASTDEISGHRTAFVMSAACAVMTALVAVGIGRRH